MFYFIITTIVIFLAFQVILCAAAEVDPTHYVDSKDGSIFAVDHLTLVTREDPVESNQDASLEGLRTTVQSSINKYLATTYKSENAAGCVYAKDGKLYVVISGDKVSLKNYWSGKWSSVWTLTTDGQIAGEIKVSN